MENSPVASWQLQIVFRGNRAAWPAGLLMIWPFACLTSLIAHHSDIPLHFSHLSVLPELLCRWNWETMSSSFSHLRVGHYWNLCLECLSFNPSEVPVNSSSFFKVWPGPAAFGRYGCPYTCTYLVSITIFCCNCSHVFLCSLWAY